MAGGSDYAVNYIPQLIEQGLSANEALSQLREQGLGVRRQTFLRAWGETVAALERRADVSVAPIDRPPLGTELTSFTAPRATGYLYQIDVALRDRATGEVFFTPSGFRSQELVNYSDALAGAIAALQAAQGGERGTPAGQILGGMVTEVREFVSEEDLFGEDLGA